MGVEEVATMTVGCAVETLVELMVTLVLLLQLLLLLPLLTRLGTFTVVICRSLIEAMIDGSWR